MHTLDICDLGNAIRETKQFAPVQMFPDNMAVFGMWV